MSQKPPPQQPWYASLPAPKSKPVFVPRESVLDLLKTMATSSTTEPPPPPAPPSYILVDLRRTDHTGGTIKTSLNLPAQSIYPSIPTLYTLAKASGAKQVIFYCGSSMGRGTRGAGWLQDYIDAQGEAGKGLQSVALDGGIKGWVRAGPEYVELVDGYDASVWEEGGDKCAA